MLRREEIDRFYEYVTELNLKFPVAAIAEATGQSKSNVSKYLSRKLEPSESFLNAFYEKFPKEGKIVSRENILAEPENHYHVKETSSDKLLDTIAILVKQNDKLAETNRILAEKIATIPVGAGSGTDEGWDKFRIAAMNFLFEVAEGRQYKKGDARKNFERMLSGGVQANEKKGIQV